MAIKAFPAFCFWGVLFWAVSASAAINVTGVSNKSFYTDSVTFTVNSETGWDYTALLNNNPVAIDIAIEVNAPEYYRLYVHRVNQSSGIEESLTIQFLVTDSSRGSSERGLTPWTPYPPIDSAAAEFVGSQLNIVTPANYPMGLEIPVAARVNDSNGKRIGVIGDVRATGFEGYPLKLLRGVGSAFLPAASTAGVINYNAAVHSLSAPKTINIEAATTWQTVSGTISNDTDWAENARIHVIAELTVPAGVTLTVGQGSVIKIDPDLEIVVNGSIIVNGTSANPVTFTTDDRNAHWGGFLFETSTSVGDFNGAIMTASGADSRWFKNNPGHGGSHRGEQPLLYLSNGANVTLTDCYLIDHKGQTGHGEDSTLTMTRCLVQKFITAGQYNDGSVKIIDSALIEFPAYDAPFADDDNDGLYMTGGDHYFTDTLIGWALDDGLDAGSGAGGYVTVSGCWFESSYHEAMAWSNSQSGTPRYITVTDTVTMNSGQGIECGFGAPEVTATGCLSTANAIGARFGDNYDWSYDGFLDVSDSLLLYNIRDVWGRNWDDWTVATDQMSILDNYLSIPNPNFPTNTAWDPILTPSQASELIPFLTTPATTVGIGLATRETSLDISEAKNGAPVRLSTFTTNVVSIDYTVKRNGSNYDSGTLQFAPGETVKHIAFESGAALSYDDFEITISSPVNAEITGYSTVTYTVPPIPYEIKKDIIVVGDDWLYRKGTSEPPSNWNEVSFTPDGSWLIGPTPIGYETNSGYETCIATNLTDMKNGYWSVYARKTFNLDDPSLVTELTLHIDFDDGYVAYLNGTEIHSQYPPNTVAHDQAANTSNHEASCGDTLPHYDLSEFISALVPGQNVLALQVHNTKISSSDFIFIPALSVVADPYPGDFEPNGKVDLADIAILSAAWQSNTGEVNYNPRCDITTSPLDTIDLLDLQALAENWLAEF